MSALSRAPWLCLNTLRYVLLRKSGTGARLIQASVHVTLLQPRTWGIGIARPVVPMIEKSVQWPSHPRRDRQPMKRMQRARQETMALAQHSCTISGGHVVIPVYAKPAARHAKTLLLMQRTAPNHSLKPSPNGGPRGPGRRHTVHSRQPGPRVPPSVPA
jgi:hypothetical protein